MSRFWRSVDDEGKPRIPRPTECPENGSRIRQIISDRAAREEREVDVDAELARLNRNQTKENDRMKKPNAYWILATALLALSGTPGLTAQTAQARDTTELETIQAEVAGTTLLARETATQRGIRDSLNEVERRLISVERRTTSIENNLRMVRFDISVLERRVQRVETRIESMEVRLASVEEGIRAMNNSIIALGSMLEELMKLQTSEDAGPR